MAASTKSIGDKAYGSMMLGISGGREKLEEALSYLSEIEDITAEEVTD
jgi:D-methionine transport system ATP-binding protein